MSANISRKYGLGMLLLAAVFLSALPAQAERPCLEDVKTFCQDIAKSKINIVRCLEEHWDEISVECQEDQIWHQELNEALLTACALDMGTYCQGVEPAPGSDPLSECLDAHFDELSVACQEAFLDHEEGRLQ